MQDIRAIPILFRSDAPLVALKSPLTERPYVLAHVCHWADEANVPLYFWSVGYRQVQQVTHINGQVQCTPVSEQPIDRIFLFLCNHDGPAWFVLEGLLEPDETSELSAERVAELTDTFYQLCQQGHKRVLLLDNDVPFPIALLPLIPVLENPLPDATAVTRLVQNACVQHSHLVEKSGVENLHLLVRSCLGLPRLELRLTLTRLAPFCPDLTALAAAMLNYKVSKLAGHGLEFIAKPDVPAGGLDLLEAILERDCSLLSPQAAQYGLSLPKGILLWGPPGTGKSLSAKHAALKLGVPLIAANWGSLRSPKPGQSEKNLDFLLQQCGINAPVVLFFDDFEKGFAGWNSDSDGGVESRLANKLLTWMQERVEPVYVIATCNRLEKLPPELIRRFDTIVFVDLPHAGARKEIFDLHLAKYFPAFRDSACSPLSDRDWRRLLKATHLCTPAEIGQIVRKAAQEAFYQNRPGHCTLDDLLHQRSLMVPAMVREEEAILAIRNRAAFARPAASPDTSRWATSQERLLRCGASPQWELVDDWQVS
ncbi:MAG: ATP-binding protein [Leptolyngbyaceae cyanobacterium bins.302]|nr:ATP-binding protein [Leptolyngbyaceae cyanobacterium bins.302]